MYPSPLPKLWVSKARLLPFSPTLTTGKHNWQDLHPNYANLFSTGVCGSAGVLDALVRRAESGGSYAVDVSTISPFQLISRSK